MSGQLIPQPYEAEQALRIGGPFAPRVPGKVQRAVDRELARGLMGAARAQAAGYVAETRIDVTELVAERAMFGLDRLQRVEAAMARADPVKAERVAGLVDDFLMIARCELRRLPREF